MTAWFTMPVWPAIFSAQAMPSSSARSEEHTSELQSLMRISYAVFCLKKKTKGEIDKCLLVDISRTWPKKTNMTRKSKTTGVSHFNRTHSNHTEHACVIV